MKLCHQLLRLERQHKVLLKSISNSHVNLFFLFYLGLKRQIRLYTPVVQIRLYTPVVLSKTIPNSRPNGKTLYPFLDPNGAKTIPLGVAHTYIPYIREYTFRGHPPSQVKLREQLYEKKVDLFVRANSARAHWP